MTERYGHSGTISVAISFSRGNQEEYREAIVEVIKSFERGSRRPYDVSVYMDRDNIPGDEFNVVIDQRFRDADIIICLVTNSFINNRYVLKYERPIIEGFGNQNRIDKRVVPIIVSRTNNYINSWLGVLRRNTLPTLTAVAKPYSHYSNKVNADLKIKTGLDKVFRSFHNDVVRRRVRGQKVVGQKYPTRNLMLALIIIIAFLLLWKLIQPNNLSQDYERREAPRIRRVSPDTALPKPYRLEEPIEEIEPKERNPKLIPRDRDLPKQLREYDNPPPGIALCNSKSSMQTVFPRDLSEYPYFGKENYGRYESCQGLNKSGYKPCKRNRRWYIVNERKNQHLKLQLGREIHEDIYAIRPLLNNVAEVYYYDGRSMYLAFCVSLKDGKEVE